MIPDEAVEAAHIPGSSAAECPCEECRECCSTFAPERKGASVIPDKATKAAQDTFIEVLTDLRLKEGGGFKVASQQRRAIAAALEAAAPHLMAAAWDEGYLACVDDIFRDQELGKTGHRLEDGQQNPYRKAPGA